MSRTKEIKIIHYGDDVSLSVLNYTFNLPPKVRKIFEKNSTGVLERELKGEKIKYYEADKLIWNGIEKYKT